MGRLTWAPRNALGRTCEEAKLASGLLGFGYGAAAAFGARNSLLGCSESAEEANSSQS